MFLTFFNHCCKFTPSQPSADAHECRLRGKGVLKRIFEEDFPHPKENFFASQKGNYCFIHEYVESKVDNMFIIRVAYRQIIEQEYNVNEFKHLYLYVIWDFRADEPRFMIEVNSKSKKSTDVVRMVFEHTLNKTLEECGSYLTFERQEGIIDMPECVRPVLSLLRDEDRSLEGFHKVPDIGEYYKKKERMKVIPNNNDEQKDKSLLDDLKEKLKPIFYNHDENIKLFLKTIRGMKQNDITDLVNKWVSERLISNFGYSRKGVLWTILHDAGLYKRSKQNWCRRVY